MLWWLGDDPELAAETRHAIDEVAESVTVSVATIWEIAIKRSLGRLDSPPDLLERLRENQIARLAVGEDHAIAAGSLPLHHRDPFDRILVAQARLEGLTLVTRDPVLHQYGVPILAA